MYTMSGEEGGGRGRNMEKVFATWEKVVATCSLQVCNMFATNSQHVHYVRGGARGRNMEKVFAT
jgi:hypothetical protein